MIVIEFIPVIPVYNFNVLGNHRQYFGMFEYDIPVHHYVFVVFLTDGKYFIVVIGMNLCDAFFFDKFFTVSQTHIKTFIRSDVDIGTRKCIENFLQHVFQQHVN